MIRLEKFGIGQRRATVCEARVPRKWMRRPAARLAGLGIALAIGVGTALGAEAPEPSKEGVAASTNSSVRVSFEIAPLDASRASGEITADEPVRVRFAFRDSATGEPMKGLYPEAWLDLEETFPATKTKAPAKRIQTYRSGSIFSRPEVDLNVYYVVAMTAAPVLTVVDPLFGFGGTKLLAMVELSGVGEDWALLGDQSRLFVSIPEVNHLAVVDTVAWKAETHLNLGARPERVALQPDGRYLWVVCEGSGHASEEASIHVVDTKTLEIAARLPLGAGPHRLAASDDNRLMSVSSAADGSVSLFDVRSLSLRKKIKTGSQPGAIAYSSVARMFYVADARDGVISGIDPERAEVTARVEAGKGIDELRFPPGGRYGVVLNPGADLVQILDSSRNRIAQSGKVERDPWRVDFSDRFAYVQHRGVDTVLMIPLDELGEEGKPLSTFDFSGGQKPPGLTPFPSAARQIIQAPGSAAVLVANAPDKAVYYYKEGMAAPMGQFSNYGREARAVLTVDRSLRPGSEPGVYETITRIKKPGRYSAFLFLDSPRLFESFPLTVVESPAMVRQHQLEALARYAGARKPLIAGEPARVPITLMEGETKDTPVSVPDLTARVFLAPGTWHTISKAEPAGPGRYYINFTPPQPGIYYLFPESASRSVKTDHGQPILLQVAPAGELPASGHRASAETGAQ